MISSSEGVGTKGTMFPSRPSMKNSRSGLPEKNAAAQPIQSTRKTMIRFFYAMTLVERLSESVGKLSVIAGFKKWASIDAA